MTWPTRWTQPGSAAGAVSEPRYVRSGDGQVAYQLFGSGESDILLINESVLPMEALVDHAATASYLHRLSACGRLITFDRRGVGLSDPVSPGSAISLADWVADAVAVLDAVGSTCAAVVAWGPSAGLIALQLAHDHQHRVAAISLYDAIARYWWAPDYTCGVTDEVDHDLQSRLSRWGTSALADRRGRFAATAAKHPSFAEWALRWLRRGASPATVTAQFDVVRTSDVRDALPRITCPVLVINHADVEDGRFLAERLPDARYLELADPCHALFSSELDAVTIATIELVTRSPLEPATNRVLTTLLFTDIVESTATVATLGDRRWAVELDEHCDMVRRAIQRFGGHAVNTTGDGVIALFEGPSRAVQCGLAVQHAARRRGMGVRAGVHTGEVELRRDDVVGLSVHVAQRVCTSAKASQVLVSQRVVDLVAGSELRFESQGDHALKGLAGRWRLFEASAAPGP